MYWNFDRRKILQKQAFNEEWKIWLKAQHLKKKQKLRSWYQVPLWQIERKPGISDRFYILRLLCALGPRRRTQWPHKRLTQTYPRVSRSLRQRSAVSKVSGSPVACCRVRGTECSSACLEPFEGVLHYLHYSTSNSTIVSRQVKQRGGNTAPPINRNWIKDMLNMPHPWEQDPVSLSVCLSHQEASLSLLSLSIRGRTEWKPQSQKINQNDHMDHSLV